MSDPIRRPDPTRRGVLRACGAAALAGASGCVGSGVLRGRSFRPRRYLYAPGPFGRDHYRFFFVAPTAFAGVADRVSESTRGSVDRRIDRHNPAEVPVERIDDFLVIDRDAAAMRAALDGPDLVRSLEARGFVERGSYRGYALFERSDDGPIGDVVVAGVRDGTLLTSERETVGGARARVEAVADAEAGDLPRYAERSTAFAR